MRTPKILPGILAVVPATILLTAQASWSEPAAQTCRASPGSATPPGSHWYYRINHADRRHCWYLGAVDAHANASDAALAPPTPEAAPHPPDPAAPSEGAPSGASPPDSAATQVAPEQVTPAAVAEFLKSHQDKGDGPDFSARWPDGLPVAQDLNGPDAALIDTSYAENHAAADAAAQLPERWPVADAMKAPEPAAAKISLRTFCFAGAAAIALLLLAGWAAGFFRAGHRSQDRGTRRAGLAATDAGERAARWRRADGAERPPTLTDPALDVRRSLKELMRDLRRADAAADSDRSFAPRAGQAGKARRRTLQAAE